MKRALVVGMMLAIAVTLLGWVPTHAGQVVIKLGNVQNVDSLVQVSLKKFAELVAERSKNEMQVQVFPASQLGTEQEILEGVQLGTIHMFEGSTGSVGRFLPDLEAFAAPYIWRDVDHMLKAVRGPIGQELAERLVKSKGMRMLDLGWLWGNRDLTTKGKAVQGPEDLKGLKIRIQPVGIYIETLRAMGANATPMDWKEVYLALQSGVIDGQENPPTFIYDAKVYEVQKYLMITKHITQNQAIVISERFYQGLSPAFQKVLQGAAVDSGNFHTDLALKQEKVDLDRLKEKGMTIVQPNTNAFREATKDVWKKFADKWAPNLYQRILEVK